MTDKVLICLGGAWVDPAHVIGIDSTFGEDDPGWPNVKVILDTGQEVYGLRPPEKVVSAIRKPQLDDYDELTETEGDGTRPLSPSERAKRRARPGTRGTIGPLPLRAE